MPFPPGLATVRVVGSFFDGSGRPLGGDLVFRPSAPLSSPTSNVSIGGPISAYLLSGQLDVELLPTDSAGVEPAGWSWLVTENVGGTLRSWAFALPSTPTTVDIADLVPVVPVAGMAAYATKAQLDAHEADTTNIHGVPDTSVLETISGATAKVTAHTAASDPHGDRAYTDTGLATMATKLPPNPVDHGLAAWSFDPALTVSATAVSQGVLAVTKVWVRETTPVADLWVGVGIAGSGLTSGRNFAGLYSATGALLAQTYDQTVGSWASVGVKVMALTSPVTVAPGAYWVGILSNGTTTPSFARAGAGQVTALSSVGLGSQAVRFGSIGSGLNTLPSQLDLATLAAATAGTFWAAVGPSGQVPQASWRGPALTTTVSGVAIPHSLARGVIRSKFTSARLALGTYLGDLGDNTHQWEGGNPANPKRTGDHTAWSADGPAGVVKAFDWTPDNMSVFKAWILSQLTAGRYLASCNFINIDSQQYNGAGVLQGPNPDVHLHWSLLASAVGAPVDVLLDYYNDVLA